MKNAEKVLRTSTVHELRKKNNEVDELHKRLVKLTNLGKECGSERLMFGITIGSGLIDTGGGGRLGLLEFDLDASRNSNELLRSENAILRKYLNLYHSQIVDLLGEIGVKKIIKDSEIETSKHRAFIKNPVAPTYEIFQNLSSVTYQLRDKVLELFTSLNTFKQELDTLAQLHQNDKLQVETQTVSLEKLHQQQIQELKAENEKLSTSLKESEAVLERWAQFGFSGPLDSMPEILEAGR